MDRGACFRVEKLLYLEYVKEPETQALTQEVWQRALNSAQKRRSEGQRASAKDFYERSLKSYWKTAVFNRYGGEIWLLTLIGTGRVHAVSVQIVNDIFAERIREEAEREPVSDPRRAQSQSKAHASSQGRNVQRYPQPIRHSDIRNMAWWGIRSRSVTAPGPLHLGTFELSLNILVERIEAGEVTWPPAP